MLNAFAWESWTVKEKYKVRLPSEVLLSHLLALRYTVGTRAYHKDVLQWNAVDLNQKCFVLPS